MNTKREQEVEALFDDVCAHRIRADDYNQTGADVEIYNAMIGEYNAMYRKLKEYGDWARPYFIKALTDPRPPIRLMGALWAAHNAVDLAPPVLLELSNGHYGGGIGLYSWSMLKDMRKRGLTNLR